MKGKRKIRQERYEQNCSELRVLASSLGLEVWEFESWHLRIVGKQLVDFWPSTGKAWIVGSPERARPMSVNEVCSLALEGKKNEPDADRLERAIEGRISAEVRPDGMGRQQIDAFGA